MEFCASYQVYLQTPISDIALLWSALSGRSIGAINIALLRSEETRLTPSIWNLSSLTLGLLPLPAGGLHNSS